MEELRSIEGDREFGFRQVEGDFSTGNPAKIVSPSTYLKKTILDLHGAKNRLTNMINGDLNGPGHLNTTDLATLEATIKSSDSGLKYLDALGHVLKE